MSDLVVTAPDGCALRHSVVRPTGHGPWPTVLIRTPYDRRALLGEAAGWAAHGFACVVGDVRGRFGSSGAFRPYLHEETDGGAVLDAVRDLPFCDGRVLLAGASYGAHCAVRTALARPGAVAGVLAAVPALGRGETVRECGGAARLACRVGWWSEHGGRSVPRPARPVRLEALPVTGILDVPGWPALWTAPARDPALWSRLPEIGMPLLAVGGTADPFAAATAALARGWGGPARLLLGPWGHRLDADAPGAALGGARIGAVYACWARAVLDGAVTGRGELVAAGPDGRWAAPDAGLRVELSGGAFTADPDDPFPSRPRDTDLRVDDARRDRLLLHTPPLPGGELRGPVGITLQVGPSAPHADWFARLSLPGPGGRREIATAVLRHRATPTVVQLTTPPAGAVVPPGGRLVLEVAGHHFPAHARNPHTGADAASAVELRSDRRTVLAAVLDLPLSPTGRGTVAPARIPEEIAR